jgi:hypothetical protein
MSPILTGSAARADGAAKNAAKAMIAGMNLIGSLPG